MNDLHRVFFHELGHFIAHELNSVLGQGKETKSIIIRRYMAGLDLWIGEAKINCLGEEGNYVPTKNELPYYLASSTYGCFVQAYYLGGTLRDSQDKNGEDDLSKWYGALMQHELQDFNADIHEIDIQYLEELRQNMALIPLMNLEPDKYLVQNGDEYHVDLDELSKDTAGFVQTHKKNYEELVRKYDVILNNVKSEGVQNL